MRVDLERIDLVGVDLVRVDLVRPNRTERELESISLAVCVLLRSFTFVEVLSKSSLTHEVSRPTWLCEMNSPSY